MATTNGKAKTGDVKAEEVVKDAGERIEEFSQNVREKAENIRLQAVSTLQDLASKIRRDVDESEQIDEDSKEQAHKLAEGLDRAAGYIKSHKIEDLGESAVQTVREHPWQTLAIIFVIGLVLGILFRRD